MPILTIELLSMHRDNCECIHRLAKAHVNVALSWDGGSQEGFYSIFFHPVYHSESCHSLPFFYRSKTTLWIISLPFFYEFCLLFSLCHHIYSEDLKIIYSMVGFLFFTFTLLNQRHLMYCLIKYSYIQGK